MPEPGTAAPETGSGRVNDELLDRYLAGGPPVFLLYEPSEVSIVLGAGRKAEQDVILDNAEADGVAVLRRRGGGGTVVLSPGQVVLALVTEVSSPFRNLEYARTINGWFRRALAPYGGATIEDRGISDLAIGERKIVGTTVYRRRRLLFYQASLLVDPDLSLFERYLRFPSRVPDYRCGRTHLEFCTSLKLEGFRCGPVEVIAGLRKLVGEELPFLT